MEREKQKAIEREQEMKAREIAEAEKKKLEEEELARMKAAASGEPMLPPKSKFVSRICIIHTQHTNIHIILHNVHDCKPRRKR